MGDPAGIGGELIFKARETLARHSIPVIVGDLSVLDDVGRLLFKRKKFSFKEPGKGGPGDVELLDLGVAKGVRPGVSDMACGEASYRYIMKALDLISSGRVSALVTCPITKKSVQAAGVPFPGHTELLADYGATRDYVMMMKNRKMRVSLVTIHVPLREVPGLITADRVFTCIAVTHRSLIHDFGIRRPYIKVCGLNPHAGEQGSMGNEESAITEAIDRAAAAGMYAEGPFPADSLFHQRDCDAFVAMYHDQGLIPVKALDFPRTVNITLGLPFVRTSVGHGTGLAIAGKGEADPTSLIEAYRTAESMVARRARA